MVVAVVAAGGHPPGIPQVNHLGTLATFEVLISRAIGLTTSAAAAYSFCESTDSPWENLSRLPTLATTNTKGPTYCRAFCIGRSDRT